MTCLQERRRVWVNGVPRNKNPPNPSRRPADRAKLNQEIAVTVMGRKTLHVRAAPFRFPIFPTDEPLLISFDKKRQLIRDRVRGVAEGYHTAVCLVGRPGTSKTVTVREELDSLGIPYIICNARMSPMGLCELLAEHPEHVIVLEDITTLLSNAQALQILTAALDGDPKQPRIITYKTKNEDRKIEFRGGIIIISNVPLRHTPLAQAVASRVVELEHEPTDEEIAAFMRSLAAKGYKDLLPEQCQEVVAFVVEETRAYDERLDLRHMTKAFEDRRQWEHKKSKTSWEDSRPHEPSEDDCRCTDAAPDLQANGDRPPAGISRRSHESLSG